MYPELNIGGQSLLMYDVMQSVGIVIGIIVVIVYSLRQKELNKVVELIKVILVGIVCIVGIGTYFSRSVVALEVFEFDGFKGFIDSVFFEPKGNHFIGRLMAVLLFCPFFVKLLLKDKDKIHKGLNAIALFVPIMHGFSRMGCFFNGCCVGVNYTGLGSICYTQGQAYEDKITYPVFPVQLLEMAGCIIILLILFRTLKKNREIFYPMILCMNVLFFVSEFFMDKRGSILILGMSVIQYIAAIICCIVIFMMITKRKNVITTKK